MASLQKRKSATKVLLLGAFAAAGPTLRCAGRCVVALRKGRCAVAPHPLRELSALAKVRDLARDPAGQQSPASGHTVLRMAIARARSVSVVSRPAMLCERLYQEVTISAPYKT
jgi:hypothetical protein